jgi:hypothetical protein
VAHVHRFQGQAALHSSQARDRSEQPDGACAVLDRSSNQGRLGVSVDLDREVAVLQFAQ